MTSMAVFATWQSARSCASTLSHRWVGVGWGWGRGRGYGRIRYLPKCTELRFNSASQVGVGRGLDEGAGIGGQGLEVGPQACLISW